MSVIYALVGYDKLTERMAFRQLVQPADTAGIKKIAGIIEDDDSQVGDLELDSSQVMDIAGMMKIDVDLSSYDFFLEPYVLADS